MPEKATSKDTRTPAQKRFDRRVLTLHRRQIAGEVPPQGEISREDLAKALKVTERTIRRDEARALEVLRRKLGDLLPDILRNPSEP